MRVVVQVDERDHGIAQTPRGLPKGRQLLPAHLKMREMCSCTALDHERRLPPDRAVQITHETEINSSRRKIERRQKNASSAAHQSAPRNSRRRRSLADKEKRKASGTYIDIGGKVGPLRREPREYQRDDAPADHAARGRVETAEYLQNRRRGGVISVREHEALEHRVCDSVNRNEMSSITPRTGVLCANEALQVLLQLCGPSRHLRQSG